MGPQPSRRVMKMSRIAISFYLLMVTIVNAQLLANGQLRRPVRHYQSYPNVPLLLPPPPPVQRSARQNAPFIPLGGKLPLEPEHRGPLNVLADPKSETPVPIRQKENVPVLNSLSEPLPVPAFLRQPSKPTQQLPSQEITQPPYGPPPSEAARAPTPLGWSDNRNYQQQQPAVRPVQQVNLNHSPLRIAFESPSKQFAQRSFELPPSPAQLGFPAVSNMEDNLNVDVNWNDFNNRRVRRSPQRTSPQRRSQIHQDNWAVEGRQSVETRVPAPGSRATLGSRERPEREGNAYKQEYDGPYVYTQLFGPPYEVGYIRSPIPSKHVYEDYLQFVRSWSSASRDAVDAQIRANPSVAKDYSSIKYSEASPSYKETPKKDAYEEPSYKDSTPDYKEPESKKPVYEEPSSSYKEPAAKKPEYTEPAYKEPSYKEPLQKGPAYSEPSYKEAAAVYKEPAYPEPSYKEPTPSYKEPAYEEPSYKEPAYKETAYSEPSYKDPAPAYKEPAYSEPSYKEPAYSEPSYKEKTPVYKEPAYPEFAYKEKAPAYKEPAYAEPAYKEPAPAYKETNYKEEAYKEPARTEPVFRGETYRDSPSKETAHKSPAYKEDEYKSPALNYHSPQTDYVAPESEFRPTNRPPYPAAGPKSPVLIERDFVPIKSQQQQQYDPPATTYRTPATSSAPYNDAPATYDILKPFEKARQPVSSYSPAYEAPTAVYEPVTTKYKPSNNEPSYEEPVYEAPKRYETPSRDSSKKYEAPPSRGASPSAAYYQPPTRYVEPPLYPSGSNGYKTPYDEPAKYEAPSAPAYDNPPSSQYSETSLYDTPKKYETSTKYSEATTIRSPGYKIEPLAQTKYKEQVDDYVPSGYKDDVDQSSTSYQSVSQNYDTPKEDYKSPSAYKQSQPEESYSSGKDAPSYADDSKKSADAYSADSAPKKKHYPVIIGRYQVTDSSAFLPKKVGGESYEGEAKPVGSQIHGANGDEYVVYYLPYGQPLPIPVRRRRSAAEDSIDTPGRWRSLADGQGRRQRLRTQRQSEQEILTPEQVHQRIKYPTPDTACMPTSAALKSEKVEVVVTEQSAVEVAQHVTNSDEMASVTENVVGLVEPERLISQVASSFAESQQAASSNDDAAQPESVVVAIQVNPSEATEPEIRATTQLNETLVATTESAREETPPSVVQEQPSQAQEASLISQVEAVLTSEDVEEPLTYDDRVVLAQVEDELLKSSILATPENPDESSRLTQDESLRQPVGEIIVVKEVDAAVQVESQPETESAEQEDAGVAVTSVVEEPSVVVVEQQLTYPPPVKGINNKKSKPAISVVSNLPGLTQKPVKYIQPPGIAADAKREWNGYSTWWTKLGNRVAKHYNYE